MNITNEKSAKDIIEREKKPRNNKRSTKKLSLESNHDKSTTNENGCEENTTDLKNEFDYNMLYDNNFNWNNFKNKCFIPAMNNINSAVKDLGYQYKYTFICNKEVTSEVYKKKIYGKKRGGLSPFHRCI